MRRLSGASAQDVCRHSLRAAGRRPSGDSSGYSHGGIGIVTRASGRLQLCDNLGSRSRYPLGRRQDWPMPASDQQLPELAHVRRPRSCFRYREREPGRLQLRVVLRPGESVCDVLVEENGTRVEVLILTCGEIEPGNEAMDCPVHVYLSAALGDRRVVDAARDSAKVEPFTPNW